MSGCDRDQRYAGIIFVNGLGGGEPSAVSSLDIPFLFIRRYSYSDIDKTRGMD